MEIPDALNAKEAPALDLALDKVAGCSARTFHVTEIGARYAAIQDTLTLCPVGN
jgi:hypothetical protein